MLSNISPSNQPKSPEDNVILSKILNMNIVSMTLEEASYIKSNSNNISEIIGNLSTSQIKELTKRIIRAREILQEHIKQNPPVSQSQSQSQPQSQPQSTINQPPDLSSINQSLQSIGAGVDEDIENNGSFNLSIGPQDLIYLSSMDEAIKEFESRAKQAGKKPSVDNTFLIFPWTPITSPTSLDIIVTHLDKKKTNTQAQRNQLVIEMDRLGYRPISTSELTAITIIRSDISDKYTSNWFASISQDLLSLCFDSRSSDRRLLANWSSDGWSESFRFLFVRK